MLTVQRAQLSNGLAKLLGITGRIDQPLDETIISSVQMMKLDETPFNDYARNGGGYATQAAGGVGIFSYLIVRPPATSRIQVNQIIAVNESGSAVPIEIRLFTAADIALLTLGTPVALMNWSGEAVASAAGVYPLLGTQIVPASKNASTVGRLFFRWPTIANNSTATFTFTRQNAPSIAGDDPSGANAFGIIFMTANLAASLSAHVTEFPIR